jgi:hypothetical protein
MKTILSILVKYCLEHGTQLQHTGFVYYSISYISLYSSPLQQNSQNINTLHKVPVFQTSSSTFLEGALAIVSTLNNIHLSITMVLHQYFRFKVPGIGLL